MPRLTIGRAPAAPSSRNQRQRYQRILDAAVRLGSATDFERVQMQDVATEADVAIATLYRYFPSKAHLFVGVMKGQIERAAATVSPPPPSAEPAEWVAGMLSRFTDELHANRMLSMSMMQSIILSEAESTSDAATVQEGFLDLVLRAAGWRQPSEDQRRRAWLLIQCWYGVLMTMLTGYRPEESADADLRRACELLLGGDG